MLAAQHRLRKALDINRVYRRGLYGSGAGVFSVKAYLSGETCSRAVVVVGKKVDKRAVVRNRLRRQLAGSLFDIWTTVGPGYDIVISVHTDFYQLSSVELRALVIKALERARVPLINP